MAEPDYRVIAVHSYKGGVGKTTLSALLGLRLAHDGARVCLVDLDLLAPGLHQPLRMDPPSRSLIDYLVDGAGDGHAAQASEVCCHRRPGLDGAPEVYLVAGAPNADKLRQCLGYVLAEQGSGLLRARLERLLAALAKLYEIEAFVLDTPPSLFGVSAAAREVVDDRGGVSIHVCTPTRQDLAGTFLMLKSGTAARAPKDGAGRAMVLNRGVATDAREEPRQTILRHLNDAFAGELLPGVPNRRLLDGVATYRMAVVEETSSLLAFCAASAELRPDLGPLLAGAERAVTDALLGLVAP